MKFERLCNFYSYAMIYDVLLMRYWWLKKKENIMVQKWCICTIFLFVLCSLVTSWDHLRKGNFSWGFPAFSWPVGKSWQILIWEGSSHYWRCHPLEDSYRSYKKAIWMNHGKQVIKNHASIVSTSVSVYRCLLWVVFFQGFIQLSTLPC